jgi:hypothetical protein
MTTKTEFTQEEWEALQKGVTGPGFLMAVSDRSFFDSFKEAGALARHLSEARKSASSELIRELAEARGTGFGLTSSPDEIESETLGALRKAMEVLETKAPEEVDAYRSFVLEVAESVANAAAGGEAPESESLEKIRSAIGAEEGLAERHSSPGRAGRSEARTQGAPCHSERGCVGGDPSF